MESKPRYRLSPAARITVIQELLNPVIIHEDGTLTQLEPLITVEEACRLLCNLDKDV